MIAWKKLCTLKRAGDLAFCDLHQFNIALLGKQVWRLLDQRDDGLESMMSLLEARLMEKINNLESELLIYKSAMKKGVIVVGDSGATQPRIDVPKPEKFNGTKAAHDMENFLWILEQYFRGMGITSDTSKVTVASNYLCDDALLWLRHRCSKKKDNEVPIGTWTEFQKEFKEYFYPKNAEREALRSYGNSNMTDQSWSMSVTSPRSSCKSQAWEQKKASSSSWTGYKGGPRWSWSAEMSRILLRQ
ncbi:hypothetical protein GQ457_06G017380 [Hibiscus cannabinus]